MSYTLEQFHKFGRDLGGEYDSKRNCYVARVPGRVDNNPSCRIDFENNNILVIDQTGQIDSSEIVKAFRDQGVFPTIKLSSKKQIKKSKYQYFDESSEPAFNVLRTDFDDGTKQISRDKRGFEGKLQPYKFEVWHEIKEEILFLVEGEECVHSLIEKGLLATTTQGGANHWRDTYAKYFAGRNVIILPDNDDSGLEYALNAYRDISKVAKSVRILELPGLAAKGDVKNWLEAGNTKEDLQSLVDSQKSNIIPFEQVIKDKNAKLTLINGKTKNTLENVYSAVGKINNLEIWFDEFHHKIFRRWNGEPSDEWDETDGLKATLILQSALGFKKCTDEVVLKAMRLIASRDVRNEPKDWMESVTWDQFNRIDSFFIEYLGALDIPYNRMASKNFFIQIIARTYDPGCQADHMIIFEGAQGIGKSSALRTLLGRFYAEISDNPGSKDFAISLLGKLVLEIAEMSSFSKADRNLIKGLISRTIDRFRIPHYKFSKDFPRRCVIVGTTNDDDYLSDTTGARRFWPIKVGKVDLQKIKDHRDQLFAEAVARYKLGESYWEMPAQTLIEQESRRHQDTWEPEIADWLLVAKDKFDVLARPIEITTVRQILSECIGLRIEQHSKPLQMRVANILKLLGWESFLSGVQRTKHWRKIK